MITQDELKVIIQRLKCCLGTKSSEYYNLVKIGENNNIKYYNLILLSDYIKHLLKYNLTLNATNCLSQDEFENILENATNICDLCDCT